MLTQMLSQSLEGIKNLSKFLTWSTELNKHKEVCLHGHIGLSLLAFILFAQSTMATQKYHQFHSTLFPPSLHKSWHKGLSSAVEEGKHFPALSRDAHFHVLGVQNGKQGQTPLCGLTTHPEHKTPVEAGRVVHVDLYISGQPNYYPVISFSPLNDNPHTHSGGNSKQ